MIIVMRNYGINYDTGMTGDGYCTRKRFDDAVVQRELEITGWMIADEKSDPPVIPGGPRT